MLITASRTLAAFDDAALIARAASETPAQNTKAKRTLRFITEVIIRNKSSETYTPSDPINIMNVKVTS